jgi:transposase-like protein
MKRQFTKEFKSKVALEAIKEERTISEIASKFEIHPNLISNWKRQVLNSLPDIFERPNKKSDQEKKQEKEKDLLFKNIGELKVENDFLKKKYRQIYGTEPEIL